MSTIQNLKNFIRHGKQARQADTPHGVPTTNVSNVHAQQQRYNNYAPSSNRDQQAAQRAQPHAGGITEPNLGQQHKVHAQDQGIPQGAAGGFSVAAGGDNRNVAAKAGDAAAKAAEDAQERKQKKQDYDPQVLERIVAEERESKGKLPKYPGLERWQLIEKMGDGAFSNVYRAKDLQGQYAECAIKVVRKFEMNSSQGDSVLHPEFVAKNKKDPKGVERANILKEVQIMRKIDHPNIVKLVDFSESRQYYFIILELCPGGELFHQIVRLTYFSEDLSRHTIIQVAKALLYLHEDAGVVHRDIKPENLLFYPVPFMPTRNPKPKGPEDEDKADEGEFVKGVGSGGIGTIKIADFGLSKVIWDSQTMTPCGTVGYTAPEIVKDERYSKSVDMWALGCVLYTLLCGFPPFYDESIQILTEKVARGQYTFLSPWWDDISKSAQDLVSHLLTVDPAKRYDIQQFLDHPWIREALDEETTAAADAPPLATPLHARQKERFLEPKVVDQAPHLQPDFGLPSAHRRMDFRSPGAVNLREVFDVSYSVHRQEEESKRRKNFPQGYRGANGINALNEIGEDEEDYDEEYNAGSQPYNPNATNPPSKLPKSKASDVSSVEAQMKNTSLSTAAQSRNAQYSSKPQKEQKGYGQHSPAVAAAARKEVKTKGPFELNMDSSSLMARRQKKGGPDPSGLRTEMVQ